MGTGEWVRGEGEGASTCPHTYGSTLRVKDPHKEVQTMFTPTLSTTPPKLPSLQAHNHLRHSTPTL